MASRCCVSPVCGWDVHPESADDDVTTGPAATASDVDLLTESQSDSVSAESPPMRRHISLVLVGQASSPRPASSLTVQRIEPARSSSFSLVGSTEIAPSSSASVGLPGTGW